jgi:4-amino-4-deoxy-L-arabinose transferase-like glycosyltransferase
VPAEVQSPQRPDPRFERALLLLSLAALALRLLWLLLEPRCAPSGDEPSWIALGTRSMARPNRGLDPFRNGLIFYPPLYSYFVAVLFRLTRSLAAVLAVQTVVGALLVPAVGRVGRSLFGPRAGLVAAAATAFYPELVWFSTHFWSETLLLTLMWWGTERLLAADATGALGRVAAAGALFGLATLTREPPLYLVPAVLVWLAWGRKHGLRRAAVFALAFAACVLPWTVRNAIVFRAFVPVSTMGSFSLWQGNAGITHLQVIDSLAAVGGPIEQDRSARRLAWQAIRARQPLWFFEKLTSEMPDFWKAGSEALDQMVGRQSCGRLATRTVMLLEVLFAGPYLLALALFVLGLAATPAVRGKALLVALLAGYNLLHVVALAVPRYRLPVLPVVLLFAAAGAADPASRALRGTRLVLLLLLAAYALLLLAPGLPELALWRALTQGRA